MTTKTLQARIQQKAFRIVFWQLIGVVLIAFIALLMTDVTHGLSVLLGGLVYGLPNLIFVWRVFRYAGVQQMTAFLSAFFIGEAIKLILSGFLFVLVVKYLPVSLLFVLVGLAGSMLSFWIVCLWQFSSPAK
ncbi:MAG: hypothetical protein ACD_46C00307G0002 [uncultured bacterium]|nr:MAG: hypothetical protein ACD_46C00307G0002 [uncultured bacterium]